MVMQISKISQPRDSPPAVFSLASCLCGSDYEDVENESESSTSLFPTISISPILLRRFAPVVQYLAIYDHSPESSLQQLAIRAGEKTVVEGKNVDKERVVVKEMNVVEDTGKKWIEGKQAIEQQNTPFPKISAMLYRRGIVSLPQGHTPMVALGPSKTRNNSSAIYRYGFLRDGDIRVIVLDAATHMFDEVVVELQVRRRTSCAPYEAVSYVWGEEEETEIIKVNTPDGPRSLEVRSNVITMLRRLRERKDRKPLWIDAICINQGSNSEKAAQVQKMGDVYANASQTLVWMGDHTERLLYNLEHAWPYRHHVNKLKRSVEPLLKNVYFTRRWIIQELFFSKKVLLLDRYGDLNFKVLEAASEFILRHVHHLHHVDDTMDHSHLDVDAINDRRMLNALHLMHILQELRSTEDHDFMRLLVSAHVSDCRVGQDRIYALGALEKKERTVDYGTRVEELFKDFATAEFTKSLETLYCSGAFPDTYKKGCGGSDASPLPSWVPDWRSKRAWIPISLMHGQDVSRTSFGSTLRVFPKPDKKTEFNVIDSMLVVRGRITGKVERAQSIETIGGLLEFYNKDEPEADKGITRMIRTITLDSVRDGKIAKPWLEEYQNSNGRQCPLKDHSISCEHLNSAKLYECNTLRRIEDVMNGRCAFVTNNGHWAVGPFHAEKGDFMVQLDGCRFPFVMRLQVS